GFVMLCVLVFLSFLGMVIIQQNVNGFDAYYASRTPAEKTIYGALGFFNIYYSWYFSLLLLILSLNIILASIDRFPSAWSYISRPKLDASRKWLLGQSQSAVIQVDEDSAEDVASSVAKALNANRLSTTITEKKGTTFVFGESGKWNRLGAYIVHVALLTLFLGHFVALQTGFDADISLFPGQTTDQIELIQFDLDQKNRFAVNLPFTIHCTDIQQKLIDPAGSIDTFNTLDWRTQIKIDDPQYGVTVADISLNKPFSYRGYRMFQAQTIPVGNARTMKLELTPDKDGAKPFDIDLNRNGSTTLDDGTLVAYESFLPDFTFNQKGEPDTKSGEYNNPVAVLQVTPKGGEKTRVFAFAGKMAENIPVGAPKLGYKWRLKEFEKSPLAHVLSVKYDPFNAAFIAWYFGGIGLIGALIFVFFISHRRVWARIERNEITNKFEVVLGGNVNRNHLNFEEKFGKIVEEIRSNKSD
ncbi:MAG: cytochrome c biogenesis protein ResB, partial [Acidobacteria bacterium]|nr:cytochrome c biogenesis protein ResB [Acidobacteriota bacterium]